MSKNTHENSVSVTVADEKPTPVESDPSRRGSAMAQKEIRVGVVGADTNAGWAKISHIPAINGLPGLKLAALTTRNEQSARQAAEAFGADRWFFNPFALNPAVRRAVELISSGKIGRLLSANVVSTTTGFGPEMPSSHEIFNKKSSGADLLTITAGHTLDTVEALLGSVTEVDARMENVWPVVRRTDTGEDSSRETADQVGVVGKTRFGALFTAHIRGGAAPENARFVFKVTGTKGWLRLTGGHVYGFQVGDLKLASNIAFATPDEPTVSGASGGAAINVGEVYAHLLRDLHAGTYSTPGFDHALHNARLIERLALLE